VSSGPPAKRNGKDGGGGRIEPRHEEQRVEDEGRRAQEELEILSSEAGAVSPGPPPLRPPPPPGKVKGVVGGGGGAKRGRGWGPLGLIVGVGAHVSNAVFSKARQAGANAAMGAAKGARYVRATPKHTVLLHVAVCGARGRAWQILPASSSTRVLNPRFLTSTQSHDDATSIRANDICQALVRGVQGAVVHLVAEAFVGCYLPRGAWQLLLATLSNAL
jgi:hypothetical protein